MQRSSFSVSKVIIPTDQPYPIIATVRSYTNPKAILLINAGTCIRRSFYDGISAYFASHGYTTVQYDYLGVGESKPTDLKEVNRSIYDWGFKDMQIMSDWIDGQYPGLSKKIIGHSMGGQLVGLMQSVNSFDQVITIASSYGNVRNFSSLRKWSFLFSLNSIFPLLTSFYGYFPASKLGMGMDWPREVAKDWRRWNGRYLSLKQWMNRLKMKHYFDELDVPMTSYIMTDDIMATTKCIPHFRIDYPKAKIIIVAPQDYGLSELGHFKSFQPHSLAFWEKILGDLEG